MAVTITHARFARRRRRTWLAALVVLSLATAACGGDDDDSDADDAADASDVDPNGVVKVAGQVYPAGQPARFDPATSNLVSDLAWMSLVFGTLLRENEDGVVEPWMAESYEVVDPQTVTLTLRDDVTFTDGSKYDAEAVRTSLLRTRDQSTEQAKAARHGGYRSLQDVVVDSPTELTIKLSTPAAGEFVNSLSSREGAIVSPQQAAMPVGTIDATPVGAGPYVLEKLETGQLLSLRKQSDFFDADSWRLGGIDFIQTPTGPGGSTALLAGAVDYAPIQDADIERVSADSSYDTHSGTPDYLYTIINMCPNKPPFDKVEVRQALQAAIDRETLNELAYGGRAGLAYGLWPEDHVNFNPEVKKINDYDPDKAKKLLATAGVTNPSFDLYLIVGTNYERLAEAVQAQLAAVGFNVNIVPSSNIIADFYQRQVAGAVLSQGSRQRVEKYSRLYQVGVTSNVCGVGRQDIVDTVLATASLQPDDPAVTKAYQKAELMAAQYANPVPLVYPPQHVAWATDRIGDTPQFTPGDNTVRFDSFYIKQ